MENTAQQNREHFERKFQALIDDIQQLNRPDVVDLLHELQRTKTVLAGLLNIEYEYSLWEQLDAKGRFQNVCIALVVLFICESLLHPLVILLEDGHWFDDLSKTFLNDLVRYIPAYPILLVATSRHTNEQERTLLIDSTVLEEHHLALLDIELTTLDDASVKNFTAATLNGNIAPDFLMLLLKATNGNPFYLEQMIEYFKESNLLVQKAGQWDIKDKNFELSNSINAILTARLDRLSPMLKEAVKAAAVIGQEFDLPILTEVLRRKNTYIFPNTDRQMVVLEQVKQAEKDQIWQAVNDVRYAFKHSLLREAAYGMQLKTQLKQLHKLVAEAIEKVYANKIQYYYFDLAFHYEKAEIAIHADHYLKKAADYARRNFQNKLALKYYNKLLHRIEKSTERVQVLQMRGQILERLGYWELAKEAYAEALALARQLSDKYLLGHTNTSYGTLLLLQGNYDDARMHLEVGAAFFEFIEDEEGLSKVYGSLGNIYFRQGHYEEARNYFIKSIELARHSVSIMPDPQIIAHLGLTCMNQGNYEEGIYWHQQGVEIAEKTNDQLGMANLQTSLGILYFEKGDYDAALLCYEKGLKLSKELGDKHLTAITIGNIGRVYERRGNYAKAMESYVKDLDICEELGDKQGQALVNILIGDLYSVLGEFEQSLIFIEKGLELSRKLGYQKGIARAMNTLGDIYFYKEEYATSLIHYDNAIEIARDINSKLVLGFSLMEKARTLIALGRIDAAQVSHQEAMTVALALGNPDLLFEVKILTAKLCLEQHQTLEAVKLLEYLISEKWSKWQIAAAYYELSKIMPEQQAYALKAFAYYQEMYQKMPHFLFKERIKELSALYV
ncbi:MAG: tetratricopeptide repeat protein [Saprospiraceae bacterium]|nr:tetratricopeptide repeat protein [Saprospiraceae bacterium]